MMKRAFAVFLIGSVVLVVAPVLSLPQVDPRSQAGTADEEAVVIGVPAEGGKAIEFVGRSEQRGSEVAHFGYFTRVSGLRNEQLFSDPATRTEATARFTFFASTVLNARHELGNVITTAAPGRLAVYFTLTPSGDFSDPESFQTGERIATYTLHYHNVLTVQAPNQGILSGAADLRQQSVQSFMLDGRRHRLGRDGLRARLEAAGAGTRTQVDPLRAFFLLGGNIVLVER